MCRELYHPAPGLLETGQPLLAPPGGNLVVVFRRQGPPPRPDQVVGFRFDGQRQVLERLLYHPAFPQGNPPQGSLLEPARRLAGGVRGMALWSPDPAQRSGSRFLGLELVPSSPAAGGMQDGPPLRLEVRVGDL